MANNLHRKRNAKRYVVEEEIHPRMPVTEEGRSHAITAAIIMECDPCHPNLALPALYLNKNMIYCPQLCRALQGPKSIQPQ